MTYTVFNEFNRIQHVSMSPPIKKELYVRFANGRKEPPPPRDENNNESSVDGSWHSLSNMMHWLRTGSSNNGNAGGAGEIQVGSRMGMIGAVSAAADINAARERV